ncbi:MAG: LysR family transcriptional regulator [Archangium sp.]
MHIDWNELQTVEALVRLGTVQGAAAELSLRHSSISRRIEALESKLGATLFVRGARLMPTLLAKELSARVALMRASALQAEALVTASHRAKEGKVVVTTSDVLAPLLFAGLANVDAQFEVLVSDEVSALTPGQVDLALRPSHEPDGGLKGRRLGLLRLGVYRARGSASGWVQPSASLRAKTSMRWWREVPNEPSRVTCDSLLAMRDACLAGLGLAVFPTFLAKDQPRLRLERELPGGTPVWLLSAGSGDATVRERLAKSLRSLVDVWA